MDSAANPGEIDDIPDLEGPVAGLSLDSSAPGEIPDLDDIPDMEEEGLEEGDEATAPAPTAPKASVANAKCVISPEFLLRFI